MRLSSRRPSPQSAGRRTTASTAGVAAAIASAGSALAAASTAASNAADPGGAQSGARAFVEQLATTLQATLLTRFAPAYVSDAFVASRLGGAHGHTFGTLPSELVAAAAVPVIERSFRA